MFVTENSMETDKVLAWIMESIKSGPEIALAQSYPRNCPAAVLLIYIFHDKVNKKTNSCKSCRVYMTSR